MASEVVAEDIADHSAGGDGVNSEVLSALTCSVCLGMFKLPTILPQCGHTFCLSCIQQLVEQLVARNGPDVKLNCPVCRTASKIAPNLDGLHRNHQLDKAVRFYIEVNPTQKIPAVYPTNACPHLDSILEPTECKHCGNEFCHVCLFRHIERIRLELTWAVTGLEGRYEKATTEKLHENVASVKSEIENQVEKIQADIKSENKAFLEEIAKSVADYEQRACEEVRKVGAAEIASIDDVVEAAKATLDAKPELDSRVNKLNNSSLLFVPPDKVIELFHDVLERDKKVSAIEKLEGNKFEPSVTRKEDPCFKEIVEKLNKKQVAFVVNKLTEDLLPVHKKKLVSEVQLVHEAAQKGDLAVLRSVLSRPGLPRACRKFASEHHGECASDMYKQSPLIEAASNGHLDVVRFLILEMDVHSAANPDNKEFFSMAIQLAAEKGHFNIVRFLVETAKIRENGGHLPPPEIAPEPIQPSEIDRMDVEENKPPLIEVDEKPNVAARRKRRLIVGFVDEQNVDGEVEADPSSSRMNEDNQQQQPQEAALPTTTGAKKMCLNFGPAIRSAISTNQITMARYLMAQSKENADSILMGDLGERLLFSASTDGHLDAVAFLVDEMKVSPNGASATLLGQTALHGAASMGRLDVVRFLVEKGADSTVLSRLDSYHKGMPIHAAAQKGFSDVVVYFVDQKSELVKAKAGDGKTVLEIARQHKKDGVVDLLKAKMTALGVQDEEEGAQPQPVAADAAANGEQPAADEEDDGENEDEEEEEEEEEEDNEQDDEGDVDDAMSEEDSEMDDDDDDDEDDDSDV